MIRAYIATGYRNRAAYDAARCMLAARGVSITYDWTTAEPPPTHQRADRDAFLRWSAKLAVEDETTQATDGAAFPSPPPSFNRAASSDPSNGGATS